jgi:hypothetical protein
MSMFEMVMAVMVTLAFVTVPIVTALWFATSALTFLLEYERESADHICVSLRSLDARMTALERKTTAPTDYADDYDE